MSIPTIQTNTIKVTAGTIVDPSGELAKYGVQGSSLASFNAIELYLSTGFFVYITGTTTINSLGVAPAGTLRLVVFTGSLTLTHNSVSLILPTGANIQTSAGDSATLVSLGSGNWKCLGYLKASGKPVSSAKSDIGLGNVENTALSTWPGTTNVTTVGTISTGVWHGSTIDEIYGGTGQSGYTEGDMLYSDAFNNLARLPKSTSATRVITNTGTNNRPVWGQVDLTNAVTGVLKPVNGGSGLGVQVPTAPTGTTLTVDLSLGNIARINVANASGNLTMTLQNPIVGLLCSLEITQGATARTITFQSGTKQGLQGGNIWTSTGASKVDVINFYYNGTNYVILGTVPDIG